MAKITLKGNPVNTSGDLHLVPRIGQEPFYEKALAVLLN